MIKRSYNYPLEILSKQEVDFEAARFIEGYAMALSDVIYHLTGESICGKSYDPMLIEGNTAHSYAFDMKDGGRHHDLSKYKNVGDILQTLLDETILTIKEE